MGYADYGFTPNVWRPSEVPARFAGQSLLVSSTGDKTTTRNIGSPSQWTLVDTDTSSLVHGAGTSILWTGHVDPISPLAALSLDYAFSGSGAWTLSLLDAGGTSRRDIDFQGASGRSTFYLVSEAGFPVNAYNRDMPSTMGLYWLPPALVPYTWNPDTDPLGSPRYFQLSIHDRRGGTGTVTFSKRRFWSHVC